MFFFWKIVLCCVINSRENEGKNAHAKDKRMRARERFDALTANLVPTR